MGDIKQITLDGWKGESGITIERQPKTYKVIEYRKAKKTGEIAEAVHYIPAKNVLTLWTLLRRICEKEKSIAYGDLVEHLLVLYEIEHVDRDSFNGGTNRARYYFPLYYYPVKILEDYGVIEYSGRGVITRLTDGFQP